MLKELHGWFTSVPDLFCCLVALQQCVDSVKYFDYMDSRTVWRHFHMCDGAALHGDTQNCQIAQLPDSLIWMFLDHVLVSDSSPLSHVTHTKLLDIDNFLRLNEFFVWEIRNCYDSYSKPWKLQMCGVCHPHPVASWTVWAPWDISVSE